MIRHVADPRGSCVVGRCTNEPSVTMRLLSFGQLTEADFCADCAPYYSIVWRPVTPLVGEQMELV